jgi:hypothetical protein
MSYSVEQDMGNTGCAAQGKSFSLESMPQRYTGGGGHAQTHPEDQPDLH